MPCPNTIERSRFFATDHTDSYLTIIKTIGGAQAVIIVVGALVVFVGAQRTIVGAHLSIVGAQAPTEVYKLTPMLVAHFMFWSSCLVIMFWYGKQGSIGTQENRNSGISSIRK